MSRKIIKEEAILEKTSYIKDDLEAYKLLRTNIEFTSIDEPIKVLAVTSSDSAEAKSTTALNLAKAMAQQKSRVLLIDADLRIPDVHRKLKITNRSGLTNCILNNDLDETTLSKYVQLIKLPDPSHDLFVMTSGTHTPNPLELLSSKRFKETINYLKSYFNFIILDSPPVLPVADTTPIASTSDGVLFCVASNQTHRDRAIQALTQLRRVNANVIGTVLTMIPTKANTYYYYRYHYKNNSKTPNTLGHKLKVRNKKSVVYPIRNEEA